MLALFGVVLVVAGLVGLIVPALPGMPLIVAGITTVAWADGFTRIGVPTVIAVVGLGVVGTLLDAAAGLLGARRAGASRWGLAGAVVGLLAGLPFGLPGLVIGPGLGAMALEYYQDKDLRRSAMAGAGVLVGFILGTALKYAVAMTMVGLAALAYFW